MPLTIATVLVFGLALVPGAFGSYAWSIVRVLDWRQKDWESALRMVAFSIVGLSLYSITASLLGLPPAAHVIPASYAAGTLTAINLPQILMPYLGHLAFSGIVGAGAAWLDLVVSRVTGASQSPSAWDTFLRESTPGRWAVVTLKSGDVFAGFIRAAEETAPSVERDVVLGEPAQLDLATGQYTVTSYHDLFIPAELVQNVATVRKDDELETSPAVGSYLFQGASSELRKSPSPAITSGTSGCEKEGVLQTGPATEGTSEGASAPSTIEGPQKVSE